MQDIKQQLQRILETSDWSLEDRQWLLQYIDKDDTSELRQLMQKEFALNTGNGEMLNNDRAKQLLEIIHHRISGTAKVVRFSSWKRIAAAAAILIALFSGAYFLLPNKKETEIVKNEEPKPGTNDVAPGGNKAVLTLADNSIIVLNDAQNGTLTKQGAANITKLEDGRLAYSASGNSAEVLYNTVSTPRGGQYQLTLSDGTQVWLNAASSLRFPASFTGSERKVEITGEAYFEVAKSVTSSGAKQSFKVNVAGKAEVEVLGTHFNINSYADEETINTTLLEGKVKVSALNNQQPVTSNQQILSPGQQARIGSNQQLTTSNQVDLDEVMAWKTGQFNFNSLDIQTIMRQISRWYDVDVLYEGRISKEVYSGIVNRNSNMSQVLKIMEESGIKFKVEGKKLIVQQ